MDENPALKKLFIDQEINMKRLEAIYVRGTKARADPNDQSKLIEFGVAFDDLNSIRTKFETGHDEILTMLIRLKLDTEPEDEVRANFDSHLFTIKVMHRELFGSSRDMVFTQNSHAKLPKIQLPIFDGKIDEWQTFIDLFNSLIHNNSLIQPIDKFQYLITALAGEALSHVKTIQISASNYEIAYCALVKRFQNKRHLAQRYWQQINDASKLQHVSSAKPLRHILAIFSENLAALKLLGFPTEQWDFVMFNILLSKLDQSIITRFELDISSNDDSVPTYNQLTRFLEKQCRALENAVANQVSSKLAPRSFPNNNYKGASSSNSSTHKFNSSVASFVCKNEPNLNCGVCHDPHSVYKCPKLISNTPHKRYALVKEKGLCVNCLSSGHRFLACNSLSNCKVCNAKHHTLLHFNKATAETNPSSESSGLNISTTEQNHVSLLANNIPTRSKVLLATANVYTRNAANKLVRLRALLDCGSQVNFITENCFRKLGVKCTKYSGQIHGVGGILCNNHRGRLSCTLLTSDITSPVKLTVDAIILDEICGNIPSTVINRKEFNHIEGLNLADPDFHVPGGVDILLGARVFPYVITGNRIVGGDMSPVALETIFGWVVMGETSCQFADSSHAFQTCTEEPPRLDKLIQKFWELETISVTVPPSKEDTLAENIFMLYSRHRSGRFIVPLPFIENGNPLFSGSRSIALRRFSSLERRLQQNHELYTSYKEFMFDYLNQGHMELVSKPCNDMCASPIYYIPHHAVLKPDSSTTKLRVVFDASAKSLENRSLNDTLLTGPKLQKDVSTILLHFRKHNIVFTADIRQMYRQIRVSPDHRDYQRIVWRFSSSDELQDYRLTTVTYGVSSSPFQALRVIQELADLESRNFPLGAQILKGHVYVDDIISGASSLEDALILKDQLIGLLTKGGFELRKWASNSPDFLCTIPDCDRQIALSINDSPEGIIKILGLQWCPTSDTFSYTVKRMNRTCTKRVILSELALIFDPLGFLAPITFTAKCIMQHLWARGIDWDSCPPTDILHRWNKFQSELPNVSSIRIPRGVQLTDCQAVQLHGFGDASEHGYAAVIYLRVTDCNGLVRCSLLAGKSKVAPLKRVSLPRLELCAAVLLSDLMDFALNTYSQLNIANIVAWSDSKVCLYWIKSEPHRWKTFVANRVCHIQSKIPPDCWRHVPTIHNPADCASRGLFPAELTTHSLWWNGPSWLHEPSSDWPQADSIDTSSNECSEERKFVLLAKVEIEPIDVLLNKFSSLDKILRITAYCLRVHFTNHSESRDLAAPCAREIHAAMLSLVKWTQHAAFHDDIKRIKNKLPCAKPLRKLSPFLDEHGVLRVGGRLSNAHLNYDQKHPALLPAASRLTCLIISQFHDKYLHPGAQTLHYLLVQQFWIQGAKKAIRRCISNCYRCFRTNPAPPQIKMGELPGFRVTQLKPFQCVGIDYGGPFRITLGKSRGSKAYKAYVCLFVCCSTKALHLELVSELSTEAFLAALRRFIGRRGRCTDLHSDCGTNFTGASRYISQLMSGAAHTENLTWHFNPPSAPHFGGLWEAGIKSVKTHLARVIGNQLLTYEEFYTVLVQIESLLNSRPLCALSSDPNDLSCLTPGHFLTLAPLSSLPDSDLTHLNINRLDRWQLIVKMYQDFWKRWHLEYLHTLTQRSKWSSGSSQILPNMLVVLNDDSLPPLAWRLGRIIEIHPGRDGIVRVATVKTARGIFTRPIVKLSPLPNQ